MNLPYSCWGLDDILFLVSMLLGLATSSVCCETGLSKLNLVKTYLRNRLSVVNLDQGNMQLPQLQCK